MSERAKEQGWDTAAIMGGLLLRGPDRREAKQGGLLYTVLVVWLLEHHGRTFTASLPMRPWYRHKLGLSFADILREARRALSSANILDLVSDSHNFENAAPQTPPAGPSGAQLAA